MKRTPRRRRLRIETQTIFSPTEPTCTVSDERAWIFFFPREKVRDRSRGHPPALDRARLPRRERITPRPSVMFGPLAKLALLILGSVYPGYRSFKARGRFPRTGVQTRARCNLFFSDRFAFAPPSRPSPPDAPLLPLPPHSAPSVHPSSTLPSIRRSRSSKPSPTP